MALEYYDLAWDRHKNVAGLNWLMGSQPSLLDNWISNDMALNAMNYLYIIYRF
jgi:hypothetical protein